MIISERHAYAAFRDSSTTPDFRRWGASQDLRNRTAPRVRGTRSMGGGLLPLRNAWHLYPRPVPASAPEPAPELVICTVHTVGMARSAVTPANASRRNAIQRERMRLSRRRFDRGLAGDFRPARAGGARRLLPLV